MNCYSLILKDAAGIALAEERVEARSLDVAAVAMRAALRRNNVASKAELWLERKRVSVIVRRRNRLVMVSDEPRLQPTPMR